VGILLGAKVAGKDSRISRVLEMLERDAGFWICEKLRDEVLRLAGEIN
jgi:predicted nucleic acid-binding protein